MNSIIAAGINPPSEKNLGAYGAHMRTLLLRHLTPLLAPLCAEVRKRLDKAFANVDLEHQQQLAGMRAQLDRSASQFSEAYPQLFREGFILAHDSQAQDSNGLQEEMLLIRRLEEQLLHDCGQTLQEATSRLPYPALDLKPGHILRVLSLVMQRLDFDPYLRKTALLAFTELLDGVLPKAYEQLNQRLLAVGLPLAPALPGSAQRAVPNSPRTSRPATSLEGLLGVLHNLQRHQAGSLDPNGSWPPARQFRELLTAHNGVYQREHGQVFEGIGMLMAYIGSDEHLPRATRDILSHLHGPLLSAALQDRQLFTHSQHPARRFIERVSSACRRYQGEASESRVLQAIKQSLHSLLNEQNADGLPPFARQEQRLTAFLADLHRQAAQQEARQIERERGRERLLLARRNARRHVASLLRLNPPRPLGLFFEQLWCNVLILLELRLDSAGRSSQDGMELATHLVLLASQRSLSDSGREQRDAQVEKLRPYLKLLVELSEPQQEHYLQLIKRILVAAQREDAQTLQQILLPAPPEQLGHDADTAEAVVGDSDKACYPQWQALYDSLGKLDFGKPFVLREGGQDVRLKLAWFSALSGTYLFVDSTGSEALRVQRDELTLRLLRMELRPLRERHEQPSLEKVLQHVWSSFHQ